MKRFWWFVLGFLVVGGVAIVVVPRHKAAQIDLKVIARTNDVFGQQWLVLRVINQSRKEFDVVARSDALVGNKWSLVRPNRPDSGPLEVRPGIFLTNGFPAGGIWDVGLPAPTEKVRWRASVAAVREISRLENFVLWCFDKLGLEKASGPYLKKTLEFTE